MHWRWAAVVAVLALLIPASEASAAYRDVHATSYDMRARIDDSGVAQMEHAITYRVVAGALSSIELSGIEPSIAIDPQVSITAEDGRSISGQATFQPPGAGAVTGTIRVDVMEKRGLRRGVYVFKVRYKLDLLAEKAITKDLALWRISWTSPALPEGIDGERVVFDLPAAPTEPRAVRSDVEAAEGGDDKAAGIVSTLRRSADRDELEIVRLHVSQGERVTWGARVDPKAFPAVRSQDLRPPPTPVAPSPDRVHDGLHLLLIALVAAAFGWLLAKKSARTAALFEREDVVARPLLPMARPLRVAVACVCVATGVALQTTGSAIWGALSMVCAMVAAAERPPRARVRPRGPGSWSMMREREAFSPSDGTVQGWLSGDVLDASTPLGMLVFGWLLAAVVGAAIFAARTVPISGRAGVDLALLDTALLLPVFLTGTRAQLPGARPRATASWLKSLFGAMKKRAQVPAPANAGFRVVPWARHPLGSEVPDELRLLVLPRASMPGVIGIEVGATWPAVEGTAHLSPEVLVRVHDASAAAAKLVNLAPQERPVPGRRVHERVVRFKPELPTLGATRDLVLSLVRDLVDRRAQVAAVWEGVERRVSLGKPGGEAQEAAANAA